MIRESSSTFISPAERLIELNHPDHTLITYPDLGHHFYPSSQWTTESGPIPQYVLADIYSWLEAILVFQSLTLLLLKHLLNSIIILNHYTLQFLSTNLITKNQYEPPSETRGFESHSLVSNLDLVSLQTNCINCCLTKSGLFISEW